MISILSGSARPKSNTLKVSKALTIQAKKLGYNAQIIDFNGFDIPNFNAPFDITQLSSWQKETVKIMTESSHIIWVTPEYNWMPSAEMMQFINRMATESFKEIWDKKTFATVGISAGIGGRMPAVTLKNVLDKCIDFMNLNSRTIASIQEVHFVQQVMHEDGRLKDNQKFNKSFERFMEKVVEQV